MRIALVASKFPPTVGGGESIVYNLARELGKRKHEVTVVTSRLTDTGTNYKDEILFKVTTMEGFEDFCSGSGNLRSVCQDLYSILYDRHFDIIHVHNFLPMFVVSQFVNKLSAKIVFTYHNTPNPPQRIMGYFKDFSLDEEFAKNIMNNGSYDLLLAGSKFYFDWALKLGANPNKSHLTYFGVDRSRFKPNLTLKKNRIREKLGLPKNAFVITFPSRAIKRKGAIETLHALSLLKETGFNPVLYMPAFYKPFDLDFAKSFHQYVKKLNLSEQIYIPDNIIPYEQMPDIYAMSDLVIIPSYYEGLGLAALEAMSIGIPVISTNVSGINEILKDKYNGILVKPKNASELAKAILDLKSNTNLMKNLSSNGKVYVEENFSSSQLIVDIENLYKSLLFKNLPC